MERHKLTFLVADLEMNQLMKQLMKHFDLRPEYKWFYRLEFASTTTKVDGAYCQAIIQASKAKMREAKFWIPAISYLGTLFVDPTVKILSDGEREMFVGAE
jgi:hypothetical protein